MELTGSEFVESVKYHGTVNLFSSNSHFKEGELQIHIGLCLFVYMKRSGYQPDTLSKMQFVSVLTLIKVEKL